MTRRSLSGLLAVAAVLACATPAAAQRPGNDAPHGAAAFQPYTAVNGSPREQQAGADLAGATADPGVPRCLGPDSFDRTVWFRIPEAPMPRELTIDASGRTLDVVDLAAFVQPAVTPSPTGEPAPAGAPLTQRPNACAGVGSGGSDAAEEPTSAVSLHVPAHRPVLVQVGRRGTAGAREDEFALLSLAESALPDWGAPPGDAGDATAPLARSGRVNRVALVDATITEEDPAQPACPSLSTVWRRFVPGASGPRLVTVAGSQVATLTVFRGSRPSDENALDCVNRAGGGSLQMVVDGRRRQPLWIRLGADDPLDRSVGRLRILPGERVTVIDGGPGGFDPTTGGPGGGLPASCERSRPERVRLSGPRLRGPAGSRNGFRRVPVTVRVRGGAICDVVAELIGPRGRVYARARLRRVTKRATLRLPRQRTFRPGRYRLRVSAVGWTGDRERVRSSVKGRLG